MDSNEQLKLMAAALFEIRVLLSNYLGSENDGDTSVRLAAHLAYALHNEAEDIIKENGYFDLKTALEKIKTVEKLVGSNFGNGFGIL